MKIKVIMSDKAMSRETMDAREEMLAAALSSDAEISVDCIKGRMNWTVIQMKHLRQRRW